MHTGSCLCGAVRYRLDTPIQEISHCHCSMCRKAHGAAFASFVSVRPEAFHVLEGAECISSYQSSEQVKRTFCNRCGSSLQFMDQRDEHMGVTAGTLDSTLPGTRQYHIYVDSKAEWYDIEDHLPKYSNDADN